MASLGDVIARLRTALDLADDMATWLHACQQQAHETAQLLATVGQGSQQNDIEQAAALFLRAAEQTDDLLASLAVARQGIADLVDRLTHLVVHRDVTAALREPISSGPHPSTRQTRGLAETDAEWAREQARALPARPGGIGQTTGFVYTSDGTQTRIVSGWDQESASAELILVNSPFFPAPRHREGRLGVVTHVETKIATRMRTQGVTYAVVVLNNAVCRGTQSCIAAVRAILPEGYTLVVWQPGADRAITMTGKATP